MKKNLVLTAAFGFGISQLELFIKSLRKYYTGEVCFVISLNDDDIEKELKKFDCVIIKKDIDKRDIQLKRYGIFLDLLNGKNYDKILCCDSRDLYFQSDPFDFEYKGQLNFFQEDKKIKECPYNSNWIIKTYGSFLYEKVSEKIILCSGTVLGTQDKMKEYLNIMNNKISEFKYKKSFKYFISMRRDPEGRGCDQGHANYLVNSDYIKECFFYSNSKGPTATVYYLKKINFDEKSRLLNIDNEPYLIVHQYDKRWNEFSLAVNKLKRDLNTN